jgi:hypothetical protein
VDEEEEEAELSESLINEVSSYYIRRRWLNANQKKNTHTLSFLIYWT